MPHGNDKKNFNYLADFLGGPIERVPPLMRNGRSFFDPGTSGQQQFQALIFRLLNTPPQSQPWRLNDCRSAKDLSSYFYWIRPLPDRLSIVTNTPCRIAYYLLPSVKDYPDGTHEITGVPGLRLTSCGKDRIALIHLPTGGLLELVDSSTTRRGYGGERFDACSRKVFDIEFRGRDNNGWRGVFEDAVLTEAEAEVLESAAPETMLLGVLMSRINIWWHDSPDHLTVMPGTRTGSSCQLRWTTGFTVDEVGALLTASPLKIEGLRYDPPFGPGTSGLLKLGDDRVELAGPGPSEVTGAYPLARRSSRDRLWRLRMLGSGEAPPQKGFANAAGRPNSASVGSD